MSPSLLRMLRVHSIRLQGLVASALLAFILLAVSAMGAQTLPTQPQQLHAPDKFLKEYYDAYHDSSFPDVPYEEFRDRVARAWLRDHSFIRRMADELYPFYRHKMSRQEFDAEFGLDYVAVLEFGAVRALAEQGDIEAQFDLGLMYDRGEGMPEDDAEAVRWYHRAAEQGHVRAQYMLGGMYTNAQNYAEAARWWRQAAEQGHATAQVFLGDMYANGRGVLRRTTCRGHKMVPSSRRAGRQPHR